jgi:predicted ATP-grasp superfamily ATP-dependent carboligase
MVSKGPGRVLVTDGEFKHTLGIVRALAAQGHEVHVTSRTALAPSVHSRAVRRWHRVPAAGEPGYDDALFGIASVLAPVSLVAVGNGAVAAADRLRGRWSEGVRVALPKPESLETANDKSRTAALARSLGVRTPEERPATSLDAARAAFAELGAPMVLKSGREEGRKVLRYVHAESELPAAYDAVRAAAGAHVIAQSYVAGEGYGWSALYWHGRRVRSFGHRRVREWPPSGGASACAESIPSAPELERAGAKLLDALEWHGVAMVEFKGALEPGRLALMEINAKFWGSHDVALAAGVCFPCDLVALLEGREVADGAPARAVRFAWPLGGDLWHGLFRPASLGDVLRDAFSPAVARSVRWSDPAPTLYEVVQWARSAPGAWREFQALR